MLTIFPSNPVAFEQIIARISTTQTCTVDPQTVRINQQGATIKISVDPRHDCIVVSGRVPAERHDIGIGRFPPGVFEVRVLARDVLLVASEFTVIDTYAAKTRRFPLVDYTDLWWDPKEPGLGISITQHPSDRLFAAWFVYDVAGKPVWYTLQPGEWSSWPLSDIYTGPIYKTSGPYFASAFDPKLVTVTPVGTGTLTFTDYTTASFEYTVEGVSGSKSLTRMPF
jgi:hypothetical protein